MKYDPSRDARLIPRSQLLDYLGCLPWAVAAERIEAGRLPGPVWGLDPDDKRARWDIKAVDEALDRASAIPGSIEQQTSDLDRALGLVTLPDNSAGSGNRRRR